MNLWEIICDLLAVVVIVFIALANAQMVMRHPPNDDRVVNWLSGVFFIAIYALAIYQLGKHW